MPDASSAAHGRSRLVLGLGVAAVAAALLGVVTPADEVRSVYSWPPPDAPAVQPSRSWYTPLLLMRQQPESMSVVLPCALPAALPQAPRPITVVATARFPARNNGLAVTRAASRLTVHVGEVELASIAVGRAATAPAPSECTYRLRLSGAAWSLDGVGDVSRSGTLDEMPTVTGLFSALDLHSTPKPAIEVTTHPYAVTPTTSQRVLRSVAVVLALLALLVAAARPAGRVLPNVASLVRRGVREIRLPDVLVGLSLVGWLAISPAFPDDGWIFVRQTSYESAGGFSNFYNGYGANIPNGYWLEWLQHHVTGATSTLVILRLPAVLLLATTWLFCRWILARALPRAPVERAVLWALAAAFLVGSLAWGMTLRPEPATALLATAVMACMIQFLRAGSTAPVALAALLAPLAVTGHHAGLVAFAPLVVAARPLLEWARTRRATAFGISAASAAIFVVLLFLGTDVQHWREDVRTSEVSGSSSERWVEEAMRYARLSDVLYGTPLRRGAVMLMALTVLAYLLRRRRLRGRLLDFPAACLGVGLLLLVATPSKWPWHFGALIGIAAVGAAAESARLREEARHARGWDAWPLLAVAAIAVGGAWAWDMRNPWNTLDLRTKDWVADFESRLALRQVAVLVVILVLVGALLRARRGRGTYASAPWRAASWGAPVLAAPIIAFTVAILVSDARATSAWTLTRQNVEALHGSAGCGLADDLLAAVRDDRSTLVMPDLVMYLPCVRHPRPADGIVQPPDHVVTSDLWDGIGYLTSPFAGIYDLYDVEEVALDESAHPPTGLGVTLYRVTTDLPGVAFAPATHQVVEG